ncbi:DnaJ domain [Macleaya cordata]|uniref:DnaJ domain n=1 Tax=Macleaya cordata TaxID=56857 RepID=A0A200PXA9_MACCD|nr:DnaJ domain [Macleaya cordata]
MAVRKSIRDEEEEDVEVEALRLKTLAEEKYKHSNLKSALKYAKKAQSLYPDLDGISDMVTTFSILIAASKPSSENSPPDWYKILQVEPFTHINSIKKQYKKLALILHPDKNTCIASEEAFKHVGEAFRVLSDKIRRKDYDLKLRIALQSQATTSNNAVSMVDTFWTACSFCRLSHQFEKRYVGHRLICPSCKKSFLAVEVIVNDELDDQIRVRDMVRTRVRVSNLSKENREKESVGRSGVGNVKRKDTISDFLDSLRLRPQSKKAKTEKEMTLAEMQLEAKRKVDDKKMKTKEIAERTENVKVKEKEKKMKMKEISEKMEKVQEKKMKMKEISEKMEKAKEKKMKMKEMLERVENVKENNKEDKNKNTKKGKDKKKKEKEKEKKKEDRPVAVVSKESSNLEVMTVEDSDFYNFDKDRMERSFKKTQVWAVYDDDDGMPRHYGLIDEVVSVNPFEVKMSWLDLQNSGDEGLICWENSGVHISCGRFKVARKTVIDSVNFFSHVVDCERVAREIYRIYPKKGSVWALYKERVSNRDEGNQVDGDNRCYDIVVFLTSYSEIHGLSMAYLEKVKGFKTVFERREVGCHAIRWFEKDNVRLFSHQIPSKKLSGTEAPGLPKDCWELDPASLPQDLLIIEKDYLLGAA